MRIGIDCRTMLDRSREAEAAGIGYYTYYLVKNLLRENTTDEFVLFFDRRTNQKLIREVVGDRPRVAVRFCPFQALKNYMPFVYGHMVVNAMLDRAKLDLFHAPANALPLFYRGRAVLTVHDLSVYDHPEWFPTPYPKALSFAERVIVPYSVEHAARIIAVSERTKKDLVRIFHVPASRIDVVYEGADLGQGPTLRLKSVEATLKKHVLKARKYFLFLGTLEPRKNVSGAIEGFLDFALKNYRGRADYDLILAGRSGWKAEKALADVDRVNARLAIAAKRCGLKPRLRVRHLGYLGHDEKRRIMSEASGFVFPSFYEGFGLPVIEAMSMGLPVITSDRGSLKEVVGDAAIVVAPDDTAGIADAMRRLVDDAGLAERLREKGRVRAERFNWRQTARETIKVYRKVVKK